MHTNFSSSNCCRADSISSSALLFASSSFFNSSSCFLLSSSSFRLCSSSFFFCSSSFLFLFSSLRRFSSNFSSSSFLNLHKARQNIPQVLQLSYLGTNGEPCSSQNATQMSKGESVYNPTLASHKVKVKKKRISGPKYDCQLVPYKEFRQSTTILKICFYLSCRSAFFDALFSLRFSRANLFGVLLLSPRSTTLFIAEITKTIIFIL